MYKKKIDKKKNRLNDANFVHEIKAINLVKFYGKRKVIENISYNVKQGEIVGLLGPNGAGKTTSFYITVGFIKATSGNVYLDDKSIVKLQMHKRAQLGIGYLPQESSIFRKLSVENNLLAVLEYNKNLNHKERMEIVNRLLGEFNINHVRKQKGYTLSGGERRRCEIARALTVDPKFILLDEPFAGVDPIAILDIQNIIKKLKEKGLGILITDHNVRETLRITDRAYIMGHGKILVEGTPSEIIQNPLAKKVYLGEDFSM